MSKVGGNVHLLVLSGALLFSANVWGATFEVDSDSSGGAGSFRAAIMAVNAQASGNHVIDFTESNLNIDLTLELPAFTYANGTVAINGRGAVLNGSGLSGSEVGLRFQGGSAYLEGMSIINFPSHGIVIEADGSVVASCGIGTRGSTDFGNGGHGISIIGAAGVTIGGAKGGNTISGNALNGIYVLDCEDITITRNKIGLNVSAKDPLGNGQSGIQFIASRLCRVGSWLTADRNYIGSNGLDGVTINASDSCTLMGNYIGISILGEARPNASAGVQVAVGASNQIGGTAAGEGNVISGNAGSGIVISEPASETRVYGNRIGTNAAGTTAIPNGFAGVHLAGGSDNAIGGDTEGAGNVISGNTQAGVLIQSITTGNVIAGNFIGTDATGTLAIPNLYGVFLERTSGNTVGGTQPDAGNVISGNTSIGIRMDGEAGQLCSLNIVLGNRIGTTSDGLAALPNGSTGIRLQGAASNSIGGSEAGAGNLISGNTGSGIELAAGLGYGNIIQGNWIGLNGDGTAALPNDGYGVIVRGMDNEVGGVAPGAGNVISGNTESGVLIDGTDTAGTIVKGNYIGIDAAGSTDVPNGGAGVAVGNSSSNLIGGSDAGAGNYISGNTGGGIQISSSGGAAADNVVQGNVIGLYPGEGKSGASNEGAGIWLSGPVTGTLVGGAAPGQANIIAYNLNRGIWVTGGAAQNTFSRNSIYGNSAGGIILETGTNEDIENPQLMEIGDPVSGYAAPNSVVELFVDSGGQGKTYLTTTTADGGGNFSVTGLNLMPYSGMNMTATCTDSAGNTSEFSDPGTIPVTALEMSITRDTPTFYFPNQFIDITIHLEYTGSGFLTNVSVLETPPAGWQYRGAVSGPIPGAQPANGATGPFTLTWNTTIPPFPVHFTYRVYVPQSQSGAVTYTGIAGYQAGGPEIQTAPYDSLMMEGMPEVQMTRFTPPSYTPANAFDITVHLEYPAGTPDISTLAILEENPADWSFVGLLSGDLPSSAPSIGSEGSFNFAYSSGAVPPFPIEFTYRVQVPAGQAGMVSITGYAGFRLLGVSREYTSNTAYTEVNPTGGEGEGEGEGEGGTGVHAADQDGNSRVSLSELLRIIQFFNSGGFHCAGNPGDTEDGYVPGAGADTFCAAHSSDYHPAGPDWKVSLTELLRVIQFFNSGGYHYCPGDGTEDGFCPGP